MGVAVFEIFAIAKRLRQISEANPRSPDLARYCLMIQPELWNTIKAELRTFSMPGHTDRKLLDVNVVLSEHVDRWLLQRTEESQATTLAAQTYRP
jgi:hypothetical protein